MFLKGRRESLSTIRLLKGAWKNIKALKKTFVRMTNCLYGISTHFKKVVMWQEKLVVLAGGYQACWAPGAGVFNWGR